MAWSVVVVALVGYPTGLFAQPQPGSGAWWLFRVLWLAILALVMAAELALLWLARAVFSRALPTFVTPLPAWSTAALLIAGIGVVTVVLARFSVDGFALGWALPDRRGIALRCRCRDARPHPIRAPRANWTIPAKSAGASSGVKWPMPSRTWST